MSEQNDYALAVAQAVREAILVAGMEGEALDNAMEAIIAAVPRPEPVSLVWDVFKGEEWFMAVTSILNCDARTVKDELVKHGYSQNLLVSLRHCVNKADNPVSALMAEVERLRSEPPAPAEPVNSVSLESGVEKFKQLIANSTKEDFEEARKIFAKLFNLYDEPVVSDDTVNARLLDAAKLTTHAVTGLERVDDDGWIVMQVYADHLSALLEAIAAAEQQQGEKK